MVSVTRPLLELIRDRIAHGVSEAKRSLITRCIGGWIGVCDSSESWNPPSGVRGYLDVAEASAVFAATGDMAAQKYFVEGLSWLRQRRFFVPGQPAGLEADPLALLSLSIGLDTLNLRDDAENWLAGIICEAITNENDSHRSELLKLCLALATRDDSNWSALSPLLQVSLSRKHKRELSPEMRQAALRAIINAEGLQPEWSLFEAAALDTLFAVEAALDLAHPTIEQIVALLKGASAALKRWPWEDKPKTQHKDVTAQHWDIQHEYHVQSLLWAILRPVFPGLEDEENLPSVGHKHPRADILVPSLSVVIEVKYLREATQSARAKIIEEVAADTSLYLTDDSVYSSIMVFIWDATNSTHHHDELTYGIRKLRGIADVIIVSRPGEWKTGSA